jgi:hypothetical protein
MKSNPLKSLPISLLNLEKIKGFCCDFDEEPLSIPKELCYKKWFEHSSYFIGSVTHSFDKLDKLNFENSFYCCLPKDLIYKVQQYYLETRTIFIF